MCHHKLWPTSVSHSFSFLNSSHWRIIFCVIWKLLSLSSDLFFKNFALLQTDVELLSPVTSRLNGCPPFWRKVRGTIKKIVSVLPSVRGLGLGAFLRWWPPSAMWAGHLINLFMATTGYVWIIPSFWIWNYVLHVEHVSCVITNCGQHQWVIPAPL